MLTKQDILEEIRNAAKENGGVPLGSGRFKEKTGITQTEWGKYWPRFGDAQKEAGFEPNTLTQAYDDNHLYEKYISLTRELGRFPVQREITVKRNSDPDFPTRNTFLRRGARREFLSKLLKYSEEKGYKDIINLCKTAADKEITQGLEEITSKNEIGEVYLFKSGRYYKIGKTNDTVRRGTEIRIQLPERMDLIHSIKTDDPSGIEAYWHRRFEQKRKNGEWFDLDSSDVKAFKKWRRIS